jgi:2-oxoglutarate dehydrogenase E2 component (dihydrolipoamide succinyltransferase)
VRDAGDLNIAGLARKIGDLALRTRNNKIAPDELGRAARSPSPTPAAAARCSTRRSSTSRRSASSAPAPS